MIKEAKESPDAVRAVLETFHDNVVAGIIADCRKVFDDSFTKRHNPDAYALLPEDILQAIADEEMKGNGLRWPVVEEQLKYPSEEEIEVYLEDLRQRVIAAITHPDFDSDSQKPSSHALKCNMKYFCEQRGRLPTQQDFVETVMEGRVIHITRYYNEVRNSMSPQFILNEPTFYDHRSQPRLNIFAALGVDDEQVVLRKLYQVNFCEHGRYGKFDPEDRRLRKLFSREMPTGYSLQSGDTLYPEFRQGVRVVQTIAIAEELKGWSGDNRPLWSPNKDQRHPTRNRMVVDRVTKTGIIHYRKEEEGDHRPQPDPGGFPPMGL